jgi:hypothetical protein
MEAIDPGEMPSVYFASPLGKYGEKKGARMTDEQRHLS